MRRFLSGISVFAAILVSNASPVKAQEVLGAPAPIVGPSPTTLPAYPAPYGEVVGPSYTYSPFGGIVKVGPKEYIPAHEPGVFLKTTKHFGSRTIIDYNYYVPQVPQNGYYARRYLFERR